MIARPASANAVALIACAAGLLASTAACVAHAQEGPLSVGSAAVDPAAADAALTASRTTYETLSAQLQLDTKALNALFAANQSVPGDDDRSAMARAALKKSRADLKAKIERERQSLDANAAIRCTTNETQRFAGSVNVEPGPLDPSTGKSSGFVASKWAFRAWTPPDKPSQGSAYLSLVATLNPANQACVVQFAAGSGDLKGTAEFPASAGRGSSQRDSASATISRIGTRTLDGDDGKSQCTLSQAMIDFIASRHCRYNSGAAASAGPVGGSAPRGAQSGD